MRTGAGEDWRPTATREVLQARAQMLARVRQFFAVSGAMEVETPILCHAGVTDPNLQNLTTTCLLHGDRSPRQLYLQTSPEYAMKRLLAAGSGPIYQIGRAFRADESGRHHNPEFTIVEWYRPGYSYPAIIDDTAALVAAATGRQPTAPDTLTYRDAFLAHAGIDPLLASIAELTERAAAAGIGITSPSRLSRDEWLDALLGHVVAPRLGQERPLFLTEFPASQAALARVLPGDLPVAARFELFIAGIEIANGFHELTDAAEQRRRFESDLARRRERGLPDTPIDERLLAALSSGMPDCSGVALGLDRLMMVTVGAARLSEVIAFAADSA